MWTAKNVTVSAKLDTVFLHFKSTITVHDPKNSLTVPGACCKQQY